MADKYCTLKNCLMLGIHVLHTFNISENDKILLFRHTYLVCTLVITDLYHIHCTCIVFIILQSLKPNSIFACR